MSGPDITRIAAPVAVVKPLEWLEFDGDPDGIKAGEYWIYHESYGFQRYLGSVTVGKPHTTLEAAKAAAQADYEVRILSAITIQPAAQAQAEAVAGAYLACRDAIADYPRQSPDYDEWTRYDEQIAHAQDCIDTLTPADAQAALARIKAEVRKATLREAARKATSFLVGDPENGIPLRNPMAHEIETAILALIDKESAHE